MEGHVSAVPNLDISVDVENPLEDMKKIAREVRPDWDTSKIAFTDMSTGYINRNFKVYLSDAPDKGPLFLRIIIPQLLSKLMSENISVSAFIDKHNLGPKFICILKNGVCLQFLTGYSTMTWDTRAEMYRDDVWPLTADKLALYHSRSTYKMTETTEVPNKMTVDLSLLGTLVDITKNSDPESEYCKAVPSGQEWIENWNWFTRTVTSMELEIGLCHGDANPTNWLLRDDDAVVIDYDVTGLNWTANDLGWFFLCHCDFRNVDLNEYPDEDYQRKWLRRYLTKRRQIDNDNRRVTETDIDVLTKDISVGVLGAYLQGVMASMVIMAMTQKEGANAITQTTTLVLWEEFKKRRDELMAYGHK